ncbi:hypothetical protein ABZY68_36925, partial [Streptomyces sp. NPDC006482]|uniref:hypothetical protein n=1 Tax=Streptomyces sp. NPDC006482 TaxID=3154306 RepID=UPI0033A8F0C6
MTPSPAPRRRLAVAVTAVLAITAGTAVTAAPTATATTAGTASATSAASAMDVRAGYKYPADVELVSSGPSGFLGSTTRGDYDGFMTDYHWYRPDGTVTLIQKRAYEDPMPTNLAFSDIMPRVDPSGRVIELLDMSAPAGTAPVVIDLATRGSDYRYVATIGSTVLAEVGPYDGPKELHLLSKSGTTVTERTITGVPATFGKALTATGGPSAVLVTYSPPDDAASAKRALVVIDPVAGAVTRAYPPVAYEDAPRRGASSPTKLALWQDANLVVTDRATGTDTSITVGRPEDSAVLGLLGDWVAYGKATRPDGGTPGDPLVPFTARSLTDDRTVKLLDHASYGTPGPDGTLLVQGVSAARGEGVYRIALGADGTPTAELVFSTGKSSHLWLLSTDFGPVIDLDAGYRRLRLDWVLTRSDFSYTLRLVHKQSGRSSVHTGKGGYYGALSFLWEGKDPFNGDYTWDLTATPDNGTGPDVHATGEFKV